MGKYLRKGKISGEVSLVMEPQPQPQPQPQQQQQQNGTLGVRTRARTLALQPNPELSYLQLRNRRLEKPPLQGGNGVSNNKQVASTLSRDRVANSLSGSKGGRIGGESEDVRSFAGENHLNFEAYERSTRESTPCSLIRDVEAIGPPGSATRPTCSASANRRPRNMQRAIPTTPEMEAFFAGFELHQQEQFLQRYNYDIVNDIPLPGRYEWVRVDN